MNNMFINQHIKAILQSVKVTEEVTCKIFDDKVMEMGTVKLTKRKIVIDLFDTPNMVNKEETINFITESIGLGIKACLQQRLNLVNE